MRFPQGAEWLIILVLVLLLFGAKRLPDMARSLGRSARILKSETKGLRDDSAEPDGATAAEAAAPTALPPAPPAAPLPAPAQPVQQAAPQPAADAADGQAKPSAP